MFPFPYHRFECLSSGIYKIYTGYCELQSALRATEHQNTPLLLCLVPTSTPPFPASPSKLPLLLNNSSLGSALGP